MPRYEMRETREKRRIGHLEHEAFSEYAQVGSGQRTTESCLGGFLEHLRQELRGVTRRRLDRKLHKVVKGQSVVTVPVPDIEGTLQHQP